MDSPIVFSFYIQPANNDSVIRSASVKDYFSRLTTNVQVLYPTSVRHGLLLCKSKRTSEKIYRMRHVMPDGASIHLTYLTNQVFDQVKCLIESTKIQTIPMKNALQLCLPFLHATEGKLQVNPDGSIVIEGHIYILNSIHSFLLNKTLKSVNVIDDFDLRSRNLQIQLIPGNLIEQNVESVLIPVNDKYRIHRAFDQQLQCVGATAFRTYLKDLSNKGKRAREGEIMIFPSSELKITAKFLIAFTVPRISNDQAASNDHLFLNRFQMNYQQMIHRAFKMIDQNNITSLAMPVIEPNVRSLTNTIEFIQLSVRAIISAIREFSQNSSNNLKRLIIIDHKMQINQISRRVKKYQRKNQTKDPKNKIINFDDDDGQSFAYIFGVPKLATSGSSESDTDDVEKPDDYLFPYDENARF